MQMQTVLNRDFSICIHFLLTNRHDSEIIDFRQYLDFLPISQRNTRFHIIFPKHNLNFPPVSLRNTQFHMVFPKHNLDFPQLSQRSTRFHVVTMGKTRAQNSTMGLKWFETDHLSKKL